VIVPAGRLGNELALKGLNDYWGVSRSNIILAELSIVVEARGVDLSIYGYKDGMMESAGSLDYLLS
jgi:hypothetical protein